MRKLVIAALLVLATTAVFAYARQDTRPSIPMMPGRPGMMMRGMMGNMMRNSPMAISGVEVTVTDIPEGATISFTTKTGDVAELQRLVHRRAEMMKAMRDWMSAAKPDSK